MFVEIKLTFRGENGKYPSLAIKVLQDFILGQQSRTLLGWRENLPLSTAQTPFTHFQVFIEEFESSQLTAWGPASEGGGKRGGRGELLRPKGILEQAFIFRFETFVHCSFQLAG